MLLCKRCYSFFSFFDCSQPNSYLFERVQYFFSIHCKQKKEFSRCILSITFFLLCFCFVSLCKHFIWSFKRIILLFSFELFDAKYGHIYFFFYPFLCRYMLCLSVYIMRFLGKKCFKNIALMPLMRFYSCKHNKIIANLPLDCDAYTMYNNKISFLYITASQMLCVVCIAPYYTGQS